MHDMLVQFLELSVHSCQLPGLKLRQPLFDEPEVGHCCFKDVFLGLFALPFVRFRLSIFFASPLCRLASSQLAPVTTLRLHESIDIESFDVLTSKEMQHLRESMAPCIFWISVLDVDVIQYPS